LQTGFSIVELMAVLAIMLVVFTMAIPTMVRGIGNVRGRSSAESLAGLMQSARASAAKNNRFYTVVSSTAGTGVTTECIDLNWNGACDAGEPTVQLARNVQFVNSGGPSTALITCGPTLGPATCPTGYTGLNFTPEASTVLPSFNARAMPCVGNPPATEPAWPGTLCYTTDQSQSGTPPVGFLYVLQYNGLFTPSYTAIAVTPAGRISVWTYTGKDSGGNDTWTQ
jgi:prepilin-type N-terminal cleavage/methylation domain-containing protein